jgi:hypothetical protein
MVFVVKRGQNGPRRVQNRFKSDQILLLLLLMTNEIVKAPLLVLTFGAIIPRLCRRRSRRPNQRVVLSLSLHHLFLSLPTCPGEASSSSNTKRRQAGCSRLGPGQQTRGATHRLARPAAVNVIDFSPHPTFMIDLFAARIITWTPLATEPSRRDAGRKRESHFITGNGQIFASDARGHKARQRWIILKRLRGC